MALLSAALDWDGVLPERVASRQEAYWPDLRHLDEAVWWEVVQTWKRTQRRFPKLSDLLELAASITARQQTRLAAGTPSLPLPPVNWPDAARLQALRERAAQARREAQG